MHYSCIRCRLCKALDRRTAQLDQKSIKTKADKEKSGSMNENEVKQIVRQFLSQWGFQVKDLEPRSETISREG